MTDFTQLRIRLLELHKTLLEAERVRYEREHGRVTVHAFWHALTSDPSLTWLGPLNAAIVRFDELLDLPSTESTNATALSEHLGELRALLALHESPADSEPFAQRYAEIVHAQPEVAFAHGALWQLLGT